MTTTNLAPRAPVTLLILDDSPEDRGTYKAYLEQSGDLRLTFLEADETEGGMQACTDVRLDCILLDYSMPDGTGLEFLHRLNEAHPDHAPVIMVTGRGSEDVAVKCLKQGAVDYIPKANVSPEGLARAVRNAVQIARLRASVEEEQRERRLAETELRGSETRFRLLVDSVREYAIIMLDPRGTITSWNAGARQMFNYHAREIVGHPFGRLFLPEDMTNRLPQQELRLAFEHERVGADRWYLRRDGSRLWCSSVLSPITDPLGELHGYSWVVRDNSERLDVLQKLKDSLGERAGEITLTAQDLANPLQELLTHVGDLATELAQLRGQGAVAAPSAQAGHVHGKRGCSS